MKRGDCPILRRQLVCVSCLRARRFLEHMKRAPQIIKKINLQKHILFKFIVNHDKNIVFTHSSNPNNKSISYNLQPLLPNNSLTNCTAYLAVPGLVVTP